MSIRGDFQYFLMRRRKVTPRTVDDTVDVGQGDVHHGRITHLAFAGNRPVLKACSRGWRSAAGSRSAWTTASEYTASGDGDVQPRVLTLSLFLLRAAGKVGDGLSISANSALDTGQKGHDQPLAGGHRDADIAIVAIDDVLRRATSALTAAVG